MIEILSVYYLYDLGKTMYVGTCTTMFSRTVFKL